MATLQQFRRSVRRWSKRFKLHEWDVRVIEVDSLEKGKSSYAIEDTGARTVCYPQYFQAEIKVASKGLKEHNAQSADWLACHEVAHILLAPLDAPIEALVNCKMSEREANLNWFGFETERAAERIAKLFIEYD